jgi:hypothetical protein
MAEEQKEQNMTSCLTINGTVYKTSGNIQFCEEDEGHYFLAESPMMSRLDQAIQNGILGNGMQHLIKSLR